MSTNGSGYVSSKEILSLSQNHYDGIIETVKEVLVTGFKRYYSQLAKKDELPKRFNIRLFKTIEPDKTDRIAETIADLINSDSDLEHEFWKFIQNKHYKMGAHELAKAIMATIFETSTQTIADIVYARKSQ